MLFGDEDAATVDVDAIPSTSTEGGSSGNFTTFFLSLPPGYPTGKPAVSDRDTVVTYTIGGIGCERHRLQDVVWNGDDPCLLLLVSVAIDAIDDLLLEGPETVSVTIDKLLTPTDSNITKGVGSPADSLTIIDNDALTVTVKATKTAQEAPVPTAGEFTFATSGTGTTLAGTVVTYQVKVASSTAIDGTDFTLSKVGSVVIPAGPLRKR